MWYTNFNAGDLVYGRNEVVGARRRDLERNRRDIPASAFNYVNPITERGAVSATGSQSNMRSKVATDHTETERHIDQFNSGGKRERHYLNLAHMDKIIGREADPTQHALKENMKWGGTSKMGVISAHRNNRRVHYDISGITADSVFDPSHQHYNSVTSKEMRFIYKHERHLGGTIQWLNNGATTTSPFSTPAFTSATGRAAYDTRQRGKRTTDDKGHYSQRLLTNDNVNYSRPQSVPKLFRR